MKIQYDNNLKVAGIGVVPWTRLGPERWLPNYKIASFYDWDVDLDDAPQVRAVRQLDPQAQLDKLNSQRLVRNSTFQQMLRDDFSDYDLMTYKPVALPTQLAGFKLLAGDKALANMLENKVEFRQLMQLEAVPFPTYTVYERHELTVRDLAKILDGRSSVIMQDERLSGGKGTFVVCDEATLQYALESLEHMSAGTRLVVSDKIENAHERSVQCCATQYGVFVGPLQKQIIADPLLANLNVANGDKFCGAEITPTDLLVSTYDEIKKYATVIGDKITTMGYRGIFSVDCLVDDEGNVSVLEINPRVTGITPLQTMLYREGQDIPFYLLHILELAGVSYTIEDDYVNPKGPEGSLMILHSQSSKSVRLLSLPPSGVYDPETLRYGESALHFSGPEQLLLQQYMPPSVIKPGGRTMVAYTNKRILDDTDALLPSTRMCIKQITEKVEVEEI